MFGVFIDYGEGEKCVYKSDDLMFIIRKQGEYAKLAKYADEKGKKHNIISCRFGECGEV